MNGVGPLYCETLAHTGGVIIEPVNTVTNLAAFIAALGGVWLLRRYGSSSIPVILLIAALVANSISSGLWHGLRTPWALSLDVWTGLAAFLIIVFAWFAVFGGRMLGAGGVLGILVAQSAIFSFAADFTSAIILVFATVTLVGIALVLWTHRRFGRRAFWLGVGTLVLAALAALFRMIDLEVCSVVPTGTHFLWHILLAASAFVGMLLFIEVEKKKNLRGGAVTGSREKSH